MSARAGRNDLDAMIRISSVPSNEPVFLLRAQDQLAPDKARRWAADAYQQQVHVAVVEQALHQADLMDAWPTKKLPDAAHLTPGEQKRLAARFSRRAWRAHLDDAGVPLVPTVAEVLAQERGYAEATAHIRDMARALREAALCLDWRIAMTAIGGLAADDKEHARLVQLRDTLVAPALERADARHG